jgi:hypothetical protein
LGASLAAGFALVLAAGAARSQDSTGRTLCSFPDGGAVKLSLARSRLWGVAPLAVFFDATETTGSGIARPFHDLEFRWDFGDPAGGATWGSGSRAGLASRNAANGPVAAHVFETPGSYTVTLTVGAAKATCVVSVQDPEAVFAGAATTCFSTSGNFGGCPAGANRVITSDFAAVTGAAAGGNTVRRLLLRRGEAWTASSPGRLRAPGPGILGAFGPAAEPRPVVRGASTILILSSPTTPGFGDWRVMDLEFDGRGSASSMGIVDDGAASQVTLLRLSIHDVTAGIQFVSQRLDFHNARPASTGHRIWDQIAVVDSSISSTRTGGVFLSARRFSFLGNVVQGITGGPGSAEHVMRNKYIGKGVISHNSMSGAAPGKHVIKMHAPEYSSAGVLGGGLFTEQVVLSDNAFVGGDSGAAWTVTLGTTSGQYDERMRDILVERNWFRAGPGTQISLVVNASDVAVRNNICDTTGGAAHHCFSVFQRGVEPAPTNVRVQHNTCYSADPGNFSCVGLGPSASNIAVQNNLAFAPRAARAAMVNGAGASGIVVSHNSTDAQLRTLAPGWVSPTPSLPAHFRLGAASPYVDSGTAVPVHSDFFEVPRPRGAGVDLGATER